MNPGAVGASQPGTPIAPGSKPSGGGVARNSSQTRVRPALSVIGSMRLSATTATAHPSW